jgi:hypothetical protein
VHLAKYTGKEPGLDAGTACVKRLQMPDDIVQFSSTAERLSKFV